MHHDDSDPLHSLEEPTEDPELVPEEERVSQGVRMAFEERDQEERDAHEEWGKDVEGVQTPDEPAFDDLASGEEDIVTFELIEAFLSLTGDLFQHLQSEGVERDLERAVPEISLRVIEDGLGGEFPADVRSLYRLLSAMSFRWMIKGERPVLGGAFNMVPFMRTFGLWVGELWPEEEPGEGASFEQLAAYHTRWRFRGFDMPERVEGCEELPLWTMIAFDEEDLQRYDLYVYHPENKEFLRMDIQLIDYVYCVFGACASPGWQLLFTDYDFVENPWGMPDPRRWMARLETFFPAFDVGFFAQRLMMSEEGSEEE